MRVPACVRCITEALSECGMRRSGGSWSLTVLPRSTLPHAPMAPALYSKASASEVLPASAAPTSANVRTALISAVRPFDRLGMVGLLCTSGRPARRPAWARALRVDVGAAYGIDRANANGLRRRFPIPDRHACRVDLPLVASVLRHGLTLKMSQQQLSEPVMTTVTVDSACRCRRQVIALDMCRALSTTALRPSP